MTEITGHCLCGATRWAYDPPAKWMANCHCESCRRATGAAFASYIGVADGQWRWTGAAPAEYASSPGVTRFNCATCHSPMAYRSLRWPGEMHFLAAQLDDPAVFRSEGDAFAEESLPWVHLPGPAQGD